MKAKQLVVWKDLQNYAHVLDDIIFTIEENQPITKEYCDKMIVRSKKVFEKLKGICKNDK